MTKLTFSGHESFICKQSWLKKAYDFLENKNKFTDEIAIIELGVGKNMVTSIRFWARAFELSDENDNITDIAQYIFSQNGKDKYLEDIGTLWLLHYHLLSVAKASIYNLVFNEFRKERYEFTKEQLYNFLKRKCEDTPTIFNMNTINADISVFLRNYIKPDKDKIDIEDDFSGLLLDLNIVKSIKLKNQIDGSKVIYNIESNIRNDLPYQIVLYAILNNPEYGSSIAFKELEIGNNSPGMIFALNAEGLYNKIDEIVTNYKDIIFTETAGNRLIQFKKKPNKFEVLNKYYET